MTAETRSLGIAQDMSIKDLVGAVWTYKWRIICAGILGFVISAGVSLTLKPVFRGSVVVAAAESAESGSLASLASQFGGLAALGGLSLGGTPDLDQSLAVLQSVAFVQDFVQKNDVLAELFPREWDLEKGTLKSGAGRGVGGWLGSLRAGLAAAGNGGSGGDAGREDSYLLWEGYRRFRQRLSIERDRRTQLVTISVDASNPKLAASLANGLVISLNAELQRRAIAESEARLQYLNNRVPGTATVEMRDALFRLIESEQKSALMAHTRSEYALRVLGNAVAPDMRISPHRSLIALAGGFVAGFLALLVAVWSGLTHQLEVRRGRG